MVYYGRRFRIRDLIPTVLVRLATEEGEISFRARWKHSPLALQRTILYKLRNGRPLWVEGEDGRDLVFKPEEIWAAMVDGR